MKQLKNTQLTRIIDYSNIPDCPLVLQVPPPYFRGGWSLFSASRRHPDVPISIINVLCGRKYITISTSLTLWSSGVAHRNGAAASF